jgi:Gluconate 2-dehydrogenase subunit 3
LTLIVYISLIRFAMKLNRRHAIKQLLIVSAGISFIPSCVQDKSKGSVVLKNLSVDGDQEKLLAELSETIIPATGTAGAKDISAHLFVLKMMDDCYGKEDQQKFMKGMAEFNTQCKKQSGHYFADCTPEQRTSFLQLAETDKGKGASENFFYNTVKHLTIQAYTSSKFYLTKINVYKLVPGQYHGCVPVKTSV